jgi:hypothetical protein
MDELATSWRNVEIDHELVPGAEHQNSLEDVANLCPLMGQQIWWARLEVDQNLRPVAHSRAVCLLLHVFHVRLEGSEGPASHTAWLSQNRGDLLESTLKAR